MSSILFGVGMSVTAVVALALALCYRMRRPIPDVLAVLLAICAVVIGVTIPILSRMR